MVKRRLAGVEMFVTGIKSRNGLLGIGGLAANRCNNLFGRSSGIAEYVAVLSCLTGRALPTPILNG